MRITTFQYQHMVERLAKGRAVPDCAPGTSAKPKTRRIEVAEAAIQNEIEAWLRSLGQRAFWVRSRMDKATTYRVGTPDFVGWIDGKPFALEVKRRGGKLRPEQLGELLRCELAGAKQGVVHSLDEAKELLK